MPLIDRYGWSPDRSHASGLIPFPSSQSADQRIFIAMLDSFRPRVGFLPPRRVAPISLVPRGDPSQPIVFILGSIMLLLHYFIRLPSYIRAPHILRHPF